MNIKLLNSENIFCELIFFTFFLVVAIQAKLFFYSTLICSFKFGLVLLTLLELCVIVVICLSASYRHSA